jgi:hypothetical protein
MQPLQLLVDAEALRALHERVLNEAPHGGRVRGSTARPTVVERRVAEKVDAVAAERGVPQRAGGAQGGEPPLLVPATLAVEVAIDLVRRRTPRPGANVRRLNAGHGRSRQQRRRLGVAWGRAHGSGGHPRRGAPAPLAAFRQELGIGSNGGALPPWPDYREQLSVILEERPPVFSFCFNVPTPEDMQALASARIVTIGTATTLREGQVLVAAGVAAVVAQGHEAGGHRGTFLGKAEDALVGTLALDSSASARSERHALLTHEFLAWVLPQVHREQVCECLVTCRRVIIG